MSEQQVESMIEQCLRALDEDPDAFTEWEQVFLEEIAETNESKFLTLSQLEKLEQIFEQRCF